MRINKDANMKNKGVYIIINHASGSVYIGATSKSFRTRFLSHLKQLRGDKHFNSHLQSAWNKYSALDFEFAILEYVDDITILNIREKYWIDLHRLITDIYNIELEPGEFGIRALRVYGRRSKTSLQKQSRALKKYWKTPRGRKRVERWVAEKRGSDWYHRGKQDPLWQHGFSLGDTKYNEVSYWEAVEIEYQRWMDGDLTY